MYAFTRSVVGVDDKQLFTPDGTPKAMYSIAPSGEWEIFPAGYTNNPHTGEELKPMTTAAVAEYDAWKRENAEQSQRQRKNEEQQEKVETERRFRETFVNESLLASSGAAAQVILVIASDKPDSQAEALQGRVAQLLAEKGKKTVSGIFKPAFYGSLFDNLWQGDQSVLERLRVFDETSSPLLLGRASFSPAEKTDYEGLVSVQGTISIVQLKKDGRSGPWVFKASGAGNDAATATANCAKRLAEAIDLDVILK